MTKKHFIEMADRLRGTRPGETYSADWDQWKRDVLAMAAFCRSQNAAFKKERWLDYIEGKCGPNGGKIK